MKKVNVYGIKWDTDGLGHDTLNLPKDVGIELTDEEYQAAAEDPDIIVDKLSDTYGYCVCEYESDDVQVYDEDGLYQDSFGLYVNEVESKVS